MLQRYKKFQHHATFTKYPSAYFFAVPQYRVLYFTVYKTKAATPPDKSDSRWSKKLLPGLK
jgi:hypothetical protein